MRIDRKDWPWILSLVLLAAYHVALTVSTVGSYSLLRPMDDEFRLSLRYLQEAFPQSIFALENGHRPVLPGLLRWVGLRFMNGSFALQTVIAWVAGAGAVALILREAWIALRERPILFSSAASSAAAFVLSNSNARMFFHSNEAAHVFLVTAAVVVASLSTWQSLSSVHAWRWRLVCLASCLVATFSFGTGMASFAGPLTVLMVQRAKLKEFAIIAAGMAFTLVVYFLVLPGGDGVRHSLSVRVDAALLFSLLRTGGILAELEPLRPGRALIGGWVVLGATVYAALLWWRHHRFDRLETFALALLAFAIAANTTIAVGRVAYFFEFPNQVFADRYFFWSALTWAALVLFVAARMRNAKQHAHYGLALIVILLIVAGTPEAVRKNGWAMAANREVELGTVALRLGVRAGDQVARIADAGEAVAGKLTREQRRRGLPPFDYDGDLIIGSTIDAAEGGVELPWHSLRPVPNATPAGLMRFAVIPQVAPMRNERYWVVDGNGKVIGMGVATSPSAHPPNLGRLGFVTLDVVEGYVVPGAGPLGLVLRRGDRMTTIARLPPPAVAH